MEKERVCDESRMEEWTFENANMSDAVMHRVKNYVDNWEKMKRNHIGCLFWGPVGTGKSYIAGCIANELLKQEVTVKMTNFNTIIDDIFPLADKTEYINALASYQLLIIDDLDSMLKQPNCPFVLYVGTRKLVKRKEFEEYIRRELII